MGIQTQRAANTSCPRSDRFWLRELRVSQTFLDNLRSICSGHGYPAQRAANTSRPRSDRFWLRELCVSRTFLDKLRPQLFRPWIPSSARDIDGGSRWFTEVVLDEQSLPVAGSGSGLLTLRPLRPQVPQSPTIGASPGDLRLYRLSRHPLHSSIATSVSRTAESGDPRRTKQIRNDSSRDQRAVKTNFAACHFWTLSRYVHRESGRSDPLRLPTAP